MFPAILLVGTRRADFCIFKSSVLVEVLSFGFYLVNSECVVYLAVAHSLVYSYPKMCVLFFSLILLEPNSKPSFSIHLPVLFYFWLLDLIEDTGILSSTFPNFQILFIHF